MTDVREDILARLLEVVASIPNLRSAARNNVDIPEDLLPAAIVFDGDETTEDISDGSMRPPNRPTVVSMTPEIVIAQQADEVGSDITTLRRELIKLVLHDTQLVALCGAGRQGNGAIRYLGCDTDVGWMRSMHGALRAHFLFKYTLKPDDL